MDAEVVERVRDRVREGGLLPADAPVVVLLSGGRDSVCLLDVVAALAGPTRASALHVNYGLRADADAEEASCVALCARLGVPLEREAAPPAPAHGNTQAWARDLRYAAGTRRLAASGAVLAAAHTESDQVETILYRLATAPGRRALLGMAPRNGRLVRPLLGTTREETTAYCAARGLPFSDDPTNATAAYARGRVRHDVLPGLRSLHPAAERNVLRTAALLRDEADVLDVVVATALDGRREIAVDHLASLPPALGRLVLRRLAEDATGALCPRAAGRLPEVVSLHDGALDLGDGARAVVTGGILRLARTPPLPGRRAATG